MPYASTTPTIGIKMQLESLADFLAPLGVIAGSLLAFATLVKGIYAVWKKLNNIYEKVSAVSDQVFSNGGNSLYDKSKENLRLIIDLRKEFDEFREEVHGYLQENPRSSKSDK